MKLSPLIIGIALILFGFILMLSSLFLMTHTSQAQVSPILGGIILIGPIPILIGFSPSSYSNILLL